MTTFLLLLTGKGKAQNCTDTTYTGTATFYTTGSTSYCSSPFAPDSTHSAALNAAQYDTSATCGACILITGRNGSAIAVVNDLSFSAPANSMDLSADLIPIIDSLPEIAHIQWKYVGCPVTGNVQIMMDASNPYYAQVRVVNHRYPVRKLEYFDGNVYTVLPKRNDNYFIASTGLGNGPYSFRITDILGDTILETGIPLVNDSAIYGSHQFPLCSEPNAIAQLVNATSNIRVINDASGSNRFIIVNHTPNTVEYVVYDMLGRVIARGNAAGYGQQVVVTPAVGIYVVNYPHLQDGRLSQKVAVN